MNAKKIMGAVLVALLAAALFVGAGAAANTYFAYQENGPAGNSVWQKGADTVTVTGGVVGPVPSAGTYTLVGDANQKAYFTNPTATYSAIGNQSNTKYIVGNGGTAYKGDELNITISSLGTINPTKVQIITPTGAVEMKSITSPVTISSLAVGTYKVQAIWPVGTSGFTTGAPLPAIDATVFTFTVIDPTAATISTAVDTIFAGDVIAVTVKGVPGETYYLTSEYLNETESANGQIITVNPDTTNDRVYFDMPNTGVVTLYLKTLDTAEDEVKIELTTGDDEFGALVVAVAKPTLTATLGASSYFIGDAIELTLASDLDLAKDVYIYKIAGTNIKETTINDVDETKDGKNLEVTLTVANVEELDVGTYTIKVYKSSNAVVASVPVALKQPFISITEAPEVVIQGKDAKFIINAEAADAIVAYIFGTNLFMNLTEGKGIVQDTKNENKFTATVPAVNTTNMSAGQYFAVFQHPMYDKNFNIGAEGTEIVLNETGNVYGAGAENTVLFNVSKRQTANAAQALCDALDSQNIDDMYVKYSFFVAGQDESFTMSEIPTEVVKGDKIVISGVSTANAEETVTVEMISTAFAAVPKETVGSAAFIVATAKIADDGTWEVTLDTSDLNVDEYSLSVAVSNADKPWKNVKINVVEGADKPDTPDTPDVPDTPDTPDTPTEPETPGFGALAALAGLGAVAVLLLRRE